MSGPYDDIIHLPHHVSDRHPQMPMADRAAQFMPFRALTGYEDALTETARLTEDQAELDEDALGSLDARLRIVAEHLVDRPDITVTWFRPDGKKAGGAYVSVTGWVKKIDTYERVLIMHDSTKIPIDNILGLTGEILEALF